MTRALVLSEHDLDRWAEEFRAGARPAPLPYGVDALGHAGWSLEGVGGSTTDVGRKLRDVVEHRTGLAVERTAHGFGAARRSDLVLALLERQGMLPALLRAGHVPPWSRRPLVIWSCWLADDLTRADADVRRRIAKRLRGVDLITHLSRHETEVFTDLGIPAERLYAVTYGVSDDYYRPDDAVDRDIDLLAVGQDRGRDYGTLLDAVRGTHLRLDLVCKPDNLTGLDVPPNVTMHGTVSLPEYRRLLQRARIVAVPTREMAYPTGSSVALEAASSGCAVVVTDTCAMSDYFVDGRNARLMPESDPAAWREVLLALRDDRAETDRLGAGGRANVTDTFNARRMWTGLAEAITARGLAPARSA